MRDPYAAKMKRLTEAVLSGPGTLDPAVRKTIAAGTGVPAALASYVETAHKHAYTVTEKDMAALRQAGYSEDQIFEATVSAALGAGLRRLEAGLKALRGEK